MFFNEGVWCIEDLEFGCRRSLLRKVMALTQNTVYFVNSKPLPTFLTKGD